MHKFSDQEGCEAEVKQLLNSTIVNTRKNEVPSHLLCLFTEELMEEPVMLSSGFTYEKNQIEKHFEINGNFDPQTREEVSTTNLVLNRNIKDATEQFLS